MATPKELDFLSRFLNPQVQEEDPMSRMDEEQLMDLRSIEAETPENLEAPITDEEVQVAAANNEVEAFNAPKGIDRQIAGEIQEPEVPAPEVAAPAQEEPELSTQEKLLQQLRELQAGRSESLKEARAKDDKQRMVQALISAIPSLYAGAAAAKSGVFAAPTKIATPKPMAEERAKEDAESRYKNILAQYKAIVKDSPAKAKVYQTRSGLVKLDEDGNPIELYKDPSVETYAKARERSQDLSEKKFEFKEDETKKGRLEKVVKEFNNDPIVRDSKRALIAADKARKTVKEGGKMAPAVMGRLLARMAGEVGVMTDQDVASFRGSAAWTDSMERMFQQGIMGTLTETDKEEMLRMIDNLEDIEANAITNYANILSRQYSEASGVEKPVILNTILPEEAVTEYTSERGKKRAAEEKRINSEAVREASPQDKQALEWLGKNPDHPKAETIRQRLENKGLL